MSLDYDVIIIGGGPAGSSAAIYLRKAGIKVAVFEKETFPRPHVGESLLPYCYGIFKDLGILDTLEKTTVRKPGVRIINENNTLQTTYCFKNILDGPHYLSFHVLREKFDKQLLDKAKKDGANVFENHKVIDVNISNPEIAEVTLQNNLRKKKKVSCRFLIDATGQNTFMAKKFNLKIKHEKLDRVAFLAHWNCDTTTEGLNEGLLQLVYLNQQKKGWMGIQPVDVNRVSVGIVVDNSYIKKIKPTLSKDNWKKEFYLSEIKNAPFANNLLKGFDVITDIMVVGDYSYKVKNRYSTNYALIGDAGGFLDPIFASGIYLALNTAESVSKSIIELLKNGTEAGLDSMKKAYNQYDGALSLLGRFIDNFYNPSFINLAEVGKGAAESEENHTRLIIAYEMFHYLMGGDFYNEYDKYMKYLDFLENPKQMKRYMHLVMDDPKYKEKSCDTGLFNAFPMLEKI